MVVGVCSRNEDMTVNVCKKKQLTNMRAAGSDEALRLTPPRILSLEQCLEFLADDELLECTPKSLRIRKRELDHAARMRNLMKKRARTTPESGEDPIFTGLRSAGADADGLRPRRA